MGKKALVGARVIEWSALLAGAAWVASETLIKLKGLPKEISRPWTVFLHAEYSGEFIVSCLAGMFPLALLGAWKFYYRQKEVVESTTPP